MTHANNPGLEQWNGSSLRLRRLAANMTLRELAEKLNSSTSTIARWESGTHPPPAETVHRLAEILFANPDDFSREPRIV